MPRTSSLYLATIFPIVEAHFFHLPRKHSLELETALVEIQPHYNMAYPYTGSAFFLMDCYQTNKVNYIFQAI